MTRTVHHVLLESISAEPFDWGAEANIYEFPKDLPDLTPYLLRVEKTWNRDLMGCSTALIPAKTLVPNMHVGQPLMQLDGQPQVTIVPRQAGISLYDFKHPLHEKFSAAGITGPENVFRVDMAFFDALLAMNTKRGNPFIEIFEQTYTLGKLGYRSDFISDGNIMIDIEAGRLGIVDQYNLTDTPTSQNPLRGWMNLESLMECIAPPRADLWQKSLSPSLEQEWLDKRAEVSALMQEAKAIVLLTHDSGLAPPSGFAKITSTKGIALNSPPHQLVETLRNIEREATIPHR